MIENLLNSANVVDQSNSVDAVVCPPEWLKTTFTEVFDIQGGTQPPKSQFLYEPEEGYIRLLQIRDFGGKPVPTYVPSDKKLKQCQKGDLLIGRYGASVGRICSGMEGAYNVALAKVVKPESIDGKFTKAYLLSEIFQTPLRLLSRSAQNGFNKDDLASFPFFLPPLAEQKIIAAKLDELLAQVDTLKTRLDTIPKILKRFRQSVLAAAVSGRLTEGWREQSENGKSWTWVTLSEIADIKGGITKDSKKQGAALIELPYLRVANVQRYHLDLREIKTIRVPPEKVGELLLEHGDILFNEGGDLDKLGRGWIWENQIDRCCFQNHVFRARLKSADHNPKYVSYWGNTEGHEYFIRNGKQTTNLASINKSVLSKLPIRLPPSEEQTEIVRRVEQLFTYADQIEQQVKNAQARVNHLTQSILAKAFRGELTAEWRAQNPELISGENSAEALLARIKAEREAMGSKKTTRKKAKA